MESHKTDDTRRIDRLVALLDAGATMVFSAPNPDVEGDFRETLDEMLDKAEATARKEGWLS